VRVGVSGRGGASVVCDRVGLNALVDFLRDSMERGALYFLFGSRSDVLVEMGDVTELALVSESMDEMDE